MGMYLSSPVRGGLGAADDAAADRQPTTADMDTESEQTETVEDPRDSADPDGQIELFGGGARVPDTRAPVSGVAEAADSITFAPVVHGGAGAGPEFDLMGLEAPVHGTVTRNTDGTMTYTPEPGFVGLDAFEYTLSDGDGHLYSATVMLEVEPWTAPAPETLAAKPETPATKPETPAAKRVARVLSVSHGGHGAVTVEDGGVLVYRPDRGYSGTDAFTYTIVDENGRATTHTAAVWVDRKGRAILLEGGED